jgi:predicted RNA binding protein YcfA (HicA-like mRNA interferase family)
VSKAEKLKEQILGGASNANIQFDELRSLLRRLGFAERIKGSHHIFTRPNMKEIINIQPGPDGKAKKYQVNQIRGLMLSYSL